MMSSWYIFLIDDTLKDAEMEIARVFWSGRSQAIRLPKEYRFKGDKVRIRRHGNAVILEPIPESWDWLDEVVGPLDRDFEDAIKEKPMAQERPGLNELFE